MPIIVYESIRHRSENFDCNLTAKDPRQHTTGIHEIIGLGLTVWTCRLSAAHCRATYIATSSDDKTYLIIMAIVDEVYEHTTFLHMHYASKTKDHTLPSSDLADFCD